MKAGLLMKETSRIFWIPLFSNVAGLFWNWLFDDWVLKLNYKCGSLCRQTYCSFRFTLSS